MTESTGQRQARLAMFAADAVKAKSDYEVESEAVLARTARLRAERLERESVIRAPAPASAKASRKTSVKAPRKPRASIKVASKVSPKAGRRLKAV